MGSARCVSCKPITEICELVKSSISESNLEGLFSPLTLRVANEMVGEVSERDGDVLLGAKYEELLLLFFIFLFLLLLLQSLLWRCEEEEVGETSSLSKLSLLLSVINERKGRFMRKECKPGQARC